jgi:nucleotide-binding universal stress UspA family protein
MKTILVPVERNALIEGTLETACRLAKTFDSYIEGFPLGPALDTFVAAEVVGSMAIYPTDVGRDEQAVEESRRLFADAMRQNDIRDDGAAGMGASCGWNDRPTLGDGFLGSYGRVFDITIVGRPGVTTPASPRVATLEAALFESGRPILIVPPEPTRTLGEVVTVAWNGSTETARAIAFAMPILRKARRTIVQTVENSGVPGPDGEQVADYLRRNGVTCETMTVTRGSRSPGAAVIEEATKAGSDLIVKGAFTQSRIRQMIFGGTTMHLINETTLPVFMAH